MTKQPCPSCGEARLGSFRLCRLCGFDYDEAVSESAADRASDSFVPFDLFPPEPGTGPRQAANDAASRDGVLTGIVVVSGIVIVFVALLVLRPLG